MVKALGFMVRIGFRVRVKFIGVGAGGQGERSPHF